MQRLKNVCRWTEPGWNADLAVARSVMLGRPREHLLALDSSSLKMGAITPSPSRPVGRLKEIMYALSIVTGTWQSFTEWLE